MATNRKEVSLEEKMEIIKELENGASMRRFVHETGLAMANYEELKKEVYLQASQAQKQKSITDYFFKSGQ